MNRVIYNQGGFSIPEALLTTLIVLVSISALLRAFVVGTENVERSGIKRQALTYLEAEMERVRFYSHSGAYNLSPIAVAEKKVLLKNRFMQKERTVDGFLSTTISEEVQFNDLTYQTVNSFIRFEFEKKEDTLSLSTKVYRNVQ